jgi:hypothetical protein
MDWGAITAGAVTGAVTGGIASLIAPWVQLAVENRRSLRRWREERIREWRSMLATYNRSGQAVDLEGLLNDRDFLSLRQHLDPETLRRLETESGTEDKPAVVVLGATGIAANADLTLLAGEVDRLEREWKLS